MRPDQRAALSRLRRAIRAAAPDADECITYGLPGFRLHGRALVAFGARPSHCAFYPMSDTTIADHKDRLGAFETSKGTIRFQPGKPIPAALVRILVKSRIDEISAMRNRARTPGKSRVKRKPVSVARGTDVPQARLRRRFR
ncbi:MAG: DUF1801 domain-containing protein [Phycisphaerae bacterium]|nr:DUF1801 domain-containing protein [Phycisphaerae bacterium]